MCHRAAYGFGCRSPPLHLDFNISKIQMGGTYDEICTKKVYIKENNVYVELSYKDFCRRRQADQSYMDKLFIPVQGCLLEVMREQYADFYKDKERWRYLKKLDINHSLLSLEGFADSGGNMIDFIVDEAGESCAFYIADRLGMPDEMLKTAVQAAYGKEAAERYLFQRKNASLEKGVAGRISKIKSVPKRTNLSEKFKRGDSIVAFPEKKIGIVCDPVNERGVLRVQIPGKKIWINHKRVKLHVAAEELYPEDYDFSIVFETVENRKIRHDMGRKYTKQTICYDGK